MNTCQKCIRNQHLARHFIDGKLDWEKDKCKPPWKYWGGEEFPTVWFASSLQLQLGTVLAGREKKGLLKSGQNVFKTQGQ